MKEPRILVPTDFSNLSYNAFPIAVELAGLFHGTVTPLFCYIPEMYVHPATGFEMDFQTSVSETELLESEKVMLEKLENLTSEYVPDQYRQPGVLKMERPADGIVNIARDYDIVVMSTHGRTGFSRILMGSVAEKVVRYCEKPVIVVEDKLQFSPIEHILVTTDLTENSTSAFSHACDFVKATNARMDLVHVLSLDDMSSLLEANELIENRRHKLQMLIDEHLKEISDNVHPRVISTDASVHEALVNHANKTNYNLMIMATIGRTGLDYLRMGSTTANVLRHVKMPVLTIKPGKPT